MTPSDYTNDVTWIFIVPIICKGICTMFVKCDHPDWWGMLSLDGYYSHINVRESLEVFSKYKIFVVK